VLAGDFFVLLFVRTEIMTCWMTHVNPNAAMKVSQTLKEVQENLTPAVKKVL
jgi:hypothetical protein